MWTGAEDRTATPPGPMRSRKTSRRRACSAEWDEARVIVEEREKDAAVRSTRHLVGSPNGVVQRAAGVFEQALGRDAAPPCASPAEKVGEARVHEEIGVVSLAQGGNQREGREAGTGIDEILPLALSK